MRDLAVRFEEEQEAAIKEANNIEGREFALYFDQTKDVFSGHEPDPTSAFNGDRWINELGEPGKYIFEWYHPNTKGYREWGQAISEWWA